MVTTRDISNRVKCILNVVGARPNFIKIAPFLKAAKRYPRIKMFLAHTGQHYDYNMSRIFFQDLNLPKPDIHLGIGSGPTAVGCHGVYPAISGANTTHSHGEQTGRIMIELEKVASLVKPSLMVVVGDVNSTLAGALVASKLHIPLAHIEAGVRSFDKRMPEEVNRVLTDAVSDYLFAPSQTARRNLLKEGVKPDKIFVAGNIMIDALKYYFRPTDILRRQGLEPGNYAMVTLHRPANVDDRRILQGIVRALVRISRHIRIFFPIHPRTARQLDKFGLRKVLAKADNILLSQPVGYIDSLNLTKNAILVMTDSGGVQEEAVAFRVPCLTLRETTEWVETLKAGNRLVGNKEENIVSQARKILKSRPGTSSHKDIPLWDGRTSERIMKTIAGLLCRP